jgi:transmembrane sensor
MSIHVALKKVLFHAKNWIGNISAFFRAEWQVTGSGRLARKRFYHKEGQDWIDQRLYGIWMKRNEKRISFLREVSHVIHQYIVRRAQGLELSPGDKQFLNAWLSENEENLGTFKRLTDRHQLLKDLEEMRYIRSRIPARWKALEAMIDAKEPVQENKRQYPVRAILAVACLIGAGSIFFWKTNAPTTEGQAVISFQDGKQYNLEALSTHEVITYKGYVVEKLSAHRIGFLKCSPGIPVSIQTGAGCSYSVTLWDGSEVSINDSTFIRFSETGQERDVNLQGEAHFHVTQSALHPFLVHARDEVVKVLGTQFNVQSYVNEPVITTLIEGSIKVCTDKVKNGVVLTPGKQIYLDVDSTFHISDASPDNMNWVSGRFAFHDLYGAMRQISRYYGVSVIYKGHIPNRSIYGAPPKNSPLEKVLKAIKGLGIHLTQIGTRIIIEP